jgi:GNAT superfamily N-acetyltransferase
MPSVQVIRTYLEMHAPGELQEAPTPGRPPRIERIGECPVSFFRFLYAEVGRAFHWRDRLSWTDDVIHRHLATEGVSLWLLTWEAAPAGYFELRRHEDASIEIAYFGLLPEYFGRGWGKYLLTEAARTAWSFAPPKVWLHTCTLDHPAALPNYVQRGFKPVREEIYLTDVEPAGV